jgi:branched-chain amino acid aminotransferase
LKAWLDGTLLDEAEARVPALDHGFQLGDGVFETLRVYGGEAYALDEHLARLHEGIGALRIPAPAADIGQAARDVLRANDLLDARMRITVTSGLGPPGLARGSGPPSVLVVAAPLTPWPPTSTAIVSRFRRDEHSPLAGVKTISLVDHVVAFAEARDRGAHDALLLNAAGDVCEATTANVFLVCDGTAATPPLAAGCLAGITRSHLLELGAVERTLTRADLDRAEEAFLTSSTREVQPLVAIDGRPVGSGAPGPVTRRLGAAYSALVAARLG